MPNIEFLTEKRFTLATHLIQVAVENHLSLVEFLLLMYFEDAEDKTFNVDKISKVLGIEEKDVLLSFNRLLSLNFIELEACKDETNKCCEVISLEPLYRNIYEKKVISCSDYCSYGSWCSAGDCSCGAGGRI